MKKNIRHYAVAWVLALLFSMLSGCGTPAPDYGDLTTPGAMVNTSQPDSDISDLPELNFTIFMTERQSPFPAPTDQALWNLIRERTARAVGYRVIPTLVKKDGPNGYEIVKSMIASNTLPDVFLFSTQEGLLNFHPIRETDEYSYLLKEITVDEVRQNMPNLTARVKQYGLDFDQFMLAQQIAGKNWYIPADMTMDAFSNLPDYFTNNADPNLHYTLEDSFGTYGMGYDNYAVRDDILKLIYPNARTEKELGSLYLDNNGKLSVQEVADDIPVRTLDDLHGFLVKIRDLNLKNAEGTKIIPASLNLPLLLTGLFARKPVTIAQPYDQGEQYMQTEACKTLLKWMNQACRDGLLAPEDFTRTKEQKIELITKGAYAVMPADDNTITSGAFAKLRESQGFGLRLMPMGYGITDFSVDNNKYIGADATGTTGIYFNVKIKEDKAAAIMKWLDYQMSEEFDALCYWGLPEWSTGSGQDREFKAEYQGLKDWAMSGTIGEKDGGKLGLLSVPFANSDQFSAFTSLMPMDVRLVSFFKVDLGYPEAPCYIYPKEPEAILNSSDLLQICNKVMLFQDILPNETRYLKHPMWDFGMSYYYSEAHPQPLYDFRYFDPDLSDLVTGDPNQFESNWKALQADLVLQNIGDDISQGHASFADLDKRILQTE